MKVNGLHHRGSQKNPFLLKKIKIKYHLIETPSDILATALTVLFFCFSEIIPQLRLFFALQLTFFSSCLIHSYSLLHFFLCWQKLNFSIGGLLMIYCILFKSLVLYLCAFIFLNNFCVVFLFFRHVLEFLIVLCYF